MNDNFGKWRSDFRTILAHCLRDGCRGKPIAEILKPAEGDYFVLKPKHADFQFTSLDVLLAHLGAETPDPHRRPASWSSASVAFAQ